MFSSVVRNYHLTMKRTRRRFRGNFAAQHVVETISLPAWQANTNIFWSSTLDILIVKTFHLIKNTVHQNLCLKGFVSYWDTTWGACNVPVSGRAWKSARKVLCGFIRQTTKGKTLARTAVIASNVWKFGVFAFSFIFLVQVWNEDIAFIPVDSFWLTDQT